MAEYLPSGIRSPRRRRSAKKRIALSPLDSNRRDCQENNGSGLAKALGSRPSELDEEMQRLHDEIRHFRMSIDEHRESVHSLSVSLDQKNALDSKLADPDRLATFKQIESELAGLKQATHSQIGSLSEQMGQTTRTCEDRMNELVRRILRMEDSLAETLNLVRCRSSEKFVDQTKSELQPECSHMLGDSDFSMIDGLDPECKKLEELHESEKGTRKVEEANFQGTKHGSGIISHWAAVSRFSFLSQ